MLMTTSLSERYSLYLFDRQCLSLGSIHKPSPSQRGRGSHHLFDKGDYLSIRERYSVNVFGRHYLSHRDSDVEPPFPSIHKIK